MALLWNKFKDCYRGAALLMVLLVTVFVVIMGSSVMFTSYNGYIMRIVEREGASTFYDAEDLMNLVRVKFQEAASDSLEISYTRVMSEYAFIQAEANYIEEEVQKVAQERFNQYFIEELAKYTTTVNNSAGATETVHIFQVTELANGTNWFDGKSETSGSVNGYFSTSAVEKMLPQSSAPSTSAGYFETDVSGKLDASGNPYTTSNSAVGTSSSYKFDVGSGGSSGSAGSAGTFVYTFGDDGYPRLTLESVTIQYSTGSGYETNITTDIIIEMPMFTHSGDVNYGDTESGDGAVFDREGIPFDNASSIGRLWVKTSEHTTGMLVTGDMYGGVFYTYNVVNSNGSYAKADPTQIVFSHHAGRLITYHGDIQFLLNGSSDWEKEMESIYNSSTNVGGSNYGQLNGVLVHAGTEFLTSVDSELWTESVSVLTGSDLTLAGVRASDGHPYEDVGDMDFGGTFVAGDIIIHGGGEAGVDGQLINNPSNVTLAGDIFGFGQGMTGATSSALVINGFNTTLTMKSLSRLVLGGTAYLQVGRVTDSDDVLTGFAEYQLGQSMASGLDALAYMIPVKYLQYSGGAILTNPWETSATFSGVTVKTSELPSWMSGMVNSAPQIIYKSYGGSSLAYFFYDFVSDAKRVEFAEKYIANNLSSFSNNLDLMVDLVGGTSNMVGAGVLYYADASGNLKVVSEELSGDVKSELLEYEEMFANAAVTLWPDMEPLEKKYPVFDNLVDGVITTRTVDNPFDYYVNMHGDNLLTHYGYSGAILNGVAPVPIDVIGTDPRFSIHNYFDLDFDIYFKRDDQYSDDNKKIENWRCHEECDYCVYIDYMVNTYLNTASYPTDAAKQTEMKKWGPAYATKSDLAAMKTATRDDDVPRTELDKPFSTFNSANYLRIGMDYWNQNSFMEFFKPEDDGYIPTVKDSNGTAQPAPRAIYLNTGFNYGDSYLDTYDHASKGNINSLYQYSTKHLDMMIGRSGINVKSKFDGLAFSETGIAVLAPMDSNKYQAGANNNNTNEGFEYILNSYCIIDGEVKFLYEFFRNLQLIGGFTGDGDEGGFFTPGVSENDSKVNWSPNDLVYYENWERY